MSTTVSVGSDLRLAAYTAKLGRLLLAASAVAETALFAVVVAKELLSFVCCVPFRRVAQKGQVEFSGAEDTKHIRFGCGE